MHERAVDFFVEPVLISQVKMCHACSPKMVRQYGLRGGCAPREFLSLAAAQTCAEIDEQIPGHLTFGQSMLSLNKMSGLIRIDTPWLALVGRI
jgi:hypothetical protein